MSAIIIDSKKRAEEPVINHKCYFCKQTLLQSGSFNPRWPEQKQVRAVGAWRKEDIAMKEIWNPLYPGRPMAFQFQMKCKYCGHENVTTVVVQHFDKDKLIADHQTRHQVGSETHIAK